MPPWKPARRHLRRPALAVPDNPTSNATTRAIRRAILAGLPYAGTRLLAG